MKCFEYSLFSVNQYSQSPVMFIRLSPNNNLMDELIDFIEGLQKLPGIKDEIPHLRKMNFIKGYDGAATKAGTFKDLIHKNIKSKPDHKHIIFVTGSARCGDFFPEECGLFLELAGLGAKNGGGCSNDASLQQAGLGRSCGYQGKRTVILTEKCYDWLMEIRGGNLKKGGNFSYMASVHQMIKSKSILFRDLSIYSPDWDHEFIAVPNDSPMHQAFIYLNNLFRTNPEIISVERTIVDKLDNIHLKTDGTYCDFQGKYTKLWDVFNDKMFEYLETLVLESNERIGDISFLRPRLQNAGGKKGSYKNGKLEWKMYAHGPNGEPFGGDIIDDNGEEIDLTLSSNCEVYDTKNGDGFFGFRADSERNKGDDVRAATGSSEWVYNIYTGTNLIKKAKAVRPQIRWKCINGIPTITAIGFKILSLVHITNRDMLRLTKTNSVAQERSVEIDKDLIDSALESIMDSLFEKIKQLLPNTNNDKIENLARLIILKSYNATIDDSIDLINWNKEITKLGPKTINEKKKYSIVVFATKEKMRKTTYTAVLKLFKRAKKRKKKEETT